MKNLRKYLLISFCMMTILNNTGFAQNDGRKIFPENISVAVSLDSVEAAGITFSEKGRMFLTLPRVAIDHKYPSVVEVIDGKIHAFPSDSWTLNQPSKNLEDWIVSPLGLIVSGNTLWVLDEGKRGDVDGIPDGAAKLVGFDLTTKKMIKRILFKKPFFRSTIQLNDVRIDKSHGKEGTALIANNGYGQPDQSIIVVDIATGKMRELFKDQAEVSPAKGFMTYVEGMPHAYSLNKLTMPQGGVNGIELSKDQSTLFWTIPTNPKAYSIPTDKISDFNISEDNLKKYIKFEGQVTSNGGITIDKQDNIYYGDASRFSIIKKDKQGIFSLVAYDPRLIWPDGMAIYNNFLYVSIGQWQRAPNLNNGKDLRKGPYQILKIPLNEK